MSNWRRAWMQLAYQKSGPLRPAAPFLAPLSDLYGAIANRRRTAARKNTPRSCGVPVISVGNITVGGSGKTPLAQYIIKRLRQIERRPGVLMRGYKRKSDQTLVLTPESFNASQIYACGDEAALYAFRHEIPVGVAAKRAEAAPLLLDQTDCDALILDDGFQHFQFHRDIDLVLINGDAPFGNRHCLPLGPLREPLSALSDADAFIVHGGEVEFPNLKEKPIFKGELEWALVYPFQQWRTGNFDAGAPIDELKQKRAALLSGLGDPARFEQQARRLGVDVAAHYAFADHHWFSAKEIEGVAENHDAIITTEKDAMRLLALDSSIENFADKFFIIQAQWKMKDDDAFIQWLQTQIGRTGL
ncbi:MAG: tetraacyldisaccharide 4'-kinase [Candidatus Hinthialibacter antarcticus]|nr:tetraacyldisaccharide 4'-kinase [Candidatus Hinthialibacter antarcticus]